MAAIDVENIYAGGVVCSREFRKPLIERRPRARARDMLALRRWSGVIMVDPARGSRTVHFVRYLPDRMSAVYRRTADASHATLSIERVPAHVSDRAVEIAANLTIFAVPFGVRYVVDYSEMGANQLIYLFPRRRISRVR
jgi:hypothetical protein